MVEYERLDSADVKHEQFNTEEIELENLDGKKLEPYKSDETSSTISSIRGERRTMGEITHAKELHETVDDNLDVRRESQICRPRGSRWMR